MTLFDGRNDKRGKVESIVFNQRQATRRSRTSWIPASKPLSLDAIPKDAPLPSITGIDEELEPALAAPPPPMESPVQARPVPAEPTAPLVEDFGAKEKMAAVLVRATQAADAFERAVDEIANVRSRLVAEAESQLVELSLTIARRVLQREIDTSPALVIELAKQGIAALAESERVLIRVGAHLDDSITASLAQTMARKGVQFEILRDESLEPDGCIVETEFGRVDESLDARFRRVETALRVGPVRG